MQRYTLVLLVTVVVFAMGASNLGATPVLDQIYFDPFKNVSGTASQVDDSFRRAQTFTVGLSGLLNSVDMRGTPGSTMRILATTTGVPTFTVLASTNSFITTAAGWRSWDLSASGLIVTPGEVLAMDMLDGTWHGHFPGGYADGADYFVNVLDGFPTFTPSYNPSDPRFDIDTDWFFRTYVGEGTRSPDPTPTPEPASLLLLALGLAAGQLLRKLRYVSRVNPD